MRCIFVFNALLAIEVWRLLLFIGVALWAEPGHVTEFCHISGVDRFEYSFFVYCTIPNLFSSTIIAMVGHARFTSLAYLNEC